MTNAEVEGMRILTDLDKAKLHVLCCANEGETGAAISVSPDDILALLNEIEMNATAAYFSVHEHLIAKMAAVIFDPSRDATDCEEKAVGHAEGILRAIEHKKFPMRIIRTDPDQLEKS